MTRTVEINQDDELVRELLAPYARVQPVTLKSHRPRRRWRSRVALAAVALAVSGVIAAVAVAGTGWLVGSPAPANVKTDFGGYPMPVGPQPRPGQAVLVASNGAYQLYATANTQGGVCMLVSTPWQRPGANGEGGNCVGSSPDATPFWAGMGGASSSPSDSSQTLVVYGHTTSKGAASVQFDSPNGETITAPVASSGFFIADLTVSGSLCGVGTWSPSFTVLGKGGKQLSMTSVSSLLSAKKWTIPGRGQACGVMAKGPFGSSAGHLPLGA